MIKKKYLLYSEAKSIVHNLFIKSASQWRNYIRDKKIDGIPTHPDRVYKDNGWISWMDWLNTTNKQGGNRITTLNEYYFRTWSSDMAYILGFLYTDGNIFKTCIRLKLQKRDNDILYNIAKRLDYNGKIYSTNENSVTLCISSKIMVKDLQKIGLLPNKTFTSNVPNIPKKYQRDFIRGVWDGDGSIFYDKRGNAYLSSFICASKEFRNTIISILNNDIINFNPNIYDYLNKKTNNTYYHIMNGVNDTRRLRSYLYYTKDLLCLKRKRDLFEKSGDIKIASYNKKFLSYEDSKKYVRSKNIKTMREWRIYRQNNNIENIPTKPEKVYSEWEGYKKWFGTEFLSFDEARAFVQKLGLKSSLDWQIYSKSKRPKFIPANPWSYYKNDWISLKDWIGSL